MDPPFLPVRPAYSIPGAMPGEVLQIARTQRLQRVPRDRGQQGMKLWQRRSRRTWDRSRTEGDRRSNDGCRLRRDPRRRFEEHVSHDGDEEHETCQEADEVLLHGLAVLEGLLGGGLRREGVLAS
jgi:hypothetical protein